MRIAMNMHPRWRTAVLVSLSSLSSGACSGSGGPTGSASVRVGEIVKLSEPQVDLPGRVSVFLQVRDTAGRPIADLQPQDFQLLEGGSVVSATESSQRLLERPQTFRSLSLLLLDRSSSVTQTAAGRQAEIDAAKEFIVGATGSPNTYLALAWFDGQAGIRPVLDDNFQPTGFSNDRDYLLAAIENLHVEVVSSTSTNLYGAIVAGFDRLDQADAQAVAEGVVYRSLSLVTFTDGTDQAGLSQLSSAQARVDSGAYNSFTIGLGAEINQQVLAALGKDGFVAATRLEELAGTFDQTATQVRNLANSFYLLAYCSPKQDGSGEHTLTVRAGGGGGQAEQEYTFSADYFSGGCGFVDLSGLEPYTMRSALARDVVEAPDGSLYVVGQTQKPQGQAGRAVFVSRHDATGRLDATFGQLGYAFVGMVGGYAHLVAGGLAVAPDGSLVVVGGADNDAQPGGSRTFAVRFGSDGTLLTSSLLASPANSTESANDVAIDGAGRAVLCGSSADASGSQTAVWRLDAALQPDATFAGGGVFRHANVPATPNDAATALAIGANDSIVCVGRGTHPGSGSSAAKALRLDATGALVPGFGGGGVVVLYDAFASAQFATARDVAIDDSQRLVIVGHTTPAAGASFPTMWRMTANGQPDPTFAGLAAAGTGQVMLTPNLTANARISFGAGAVFEGLDLRSDGNILVTGYRNNGQGHLDMVVMNFNEFGRLVPAYNGTGFLIEDGSLFDDASEAGNAVLVTSTGRIVVAGWSTTTSQATSAGCLWTDSEPQRVFAPFGKRP